MDRTRIHAAPTELVLASEMVLTIDTPLLTELSMNWHVSGRRSDQSNLRIVKERGRNENVAEPCWLSCRHSLSVGLM
jgi:hypothetical protein